MLFRVLAILVCAASIARAEWTVTKSQDEAGPGESSYRLVHLVDAAKGREARIDLAIFSSKTSKLELIDNRDGTATLADAMQRSDCFAGINGGYFDGNFGPIGLRVNEGKVLAPLKRGKLMSGILMSNGAIGVVRVAEFSARSKPTAAVECGPFLVDGGKPVKGLEATREARRTFAAVTRDDRAALGAISHVTLADAGAILSKALGDFRAQRALNLDGGSSTAFWFKRSGGSARSISEQKQVRDFVGVVPK